MSLKLAMLLPLLLTSSANDARRMKTTDFDLTNELPLGQIERGLNDRGKAAANTLVGRHLVASASFCGKKLAPASSAPQAVDQAIALPLAKAAQNQKPGVIVGRTEADLAALLSRKWEELAQSRDFTISQQSILLARHGPAARSLPRWRALEADLLRYNEAMFAMRSKLFATGG